MPRSKKTALNYYLLALLSSMVGGFSAWNIATGNSTGLVGLWAWMVVFWTPVTSLAAVLIGVHYDLKLLEQKEEQTHGN